MGRMMTLQASLLVPSVSLFCSLYKSSQCLLPAQVITQLHPTKTFCEHNVWMPGKENWEHIRQQNMGVVINETSVCRLSIVRKTIHKLAWPNSIIIILQEGLYAALDYKMTQTSHQIAESNTLARTVTK